MVHVMNLVVTHVGCHEDRGHVTQGKGGFWGHLKIQRFASNAAIFFHGVIDVIFSQSCFLFKQSLYTFF